MKSALLKFWKFVNEDIWDMEISSLTALRRWGVRSLRISYLVIRGFHDDQCFLHASSLTFNTLMAIVPILALSLSLARVFGGAELAENQLRGMVYELTQRLESGSLVDGGVKDQSRDDVDGQEYPVVTEGLWTPDRIAAELNRALDAGFKQVEQINFTALGGIGLILLLWMVVAVLSNVEDSFNTVWGVVNGRPLIRKITDYLFMVIILPFLITMAASFSIAELTTQFLKEPWASYVDNFVESGIFKGVTIVALTAFTFILLIKFMPNARVGIKPAVIGGVVAAILFIGWLLLCAKVQVGVAKYSKFYGSFAIVPIILFWVYVSWEIILFGAEVAFAFQNYTTYKMEQGSRRANMHSRIILAVSVIIEAGRALTGKTGLFDISGYAHRQRIPVRFLNDVVAEMVDSGFLAPIADRDGCYVLLRAPSELSVSEIVDSVMACGVPPESLGLIEIDPRVAKMLEEASSGSSGALNRTKIQELIM